MKSILLAQAFPHFSEALRNELDVSGNIVLYKKGEIISKSGEVMTGLIILLSGCVKVYRESEKIKDREFVIAFLKKGQCYGVSITDDSMEKSRRAILTFEATEPTYVLIIPFLIKDLLAKKFDLWYKFLLQSAVQFYSFYIELIDNIIFNTLDERISFYLLQLHDAGNTSVLKVTHQQIANSLNASRESISRILKKNGRGKKNKTRPQFH